VADGALRCLFDSKSTSTVTYEQDFAEANVMLIMLGMKSREDLRGIRIANLLRAAFISSSHKHLVRFISSVYHEDDATVVLLRYPSPPSSKKVKQ
jgi:hypothetical protein